MEGGDYDQTFTVTAAQSGTPWALQATGWLKGLYLLVTAPVSPPELSPLTAHSTFSPTLNG